MSLDPSLEEQELLADTFRRGSSRMTGRERVAEWASALGLAAAVAGLWTLHPPHAFALFPALTCLLVLALAAAVWFETPLGFTVPTQLAFVPLVFAMPLALVPVSVVAALVASRLPSVLRGETRPGRLLATTSNAWFAVGPVAVFVVAGVAPRHAGPLLLLGALAAQFGLDFVISSARAAIERSAGFTSQLRDAWVFGVDAALSGIGLVVAEQIHRSALAPLALLPLIGILAVFARERHHRLESLLELNSAYRGTALVLGDVVEADDGYTGEHCKSVVALALEVGAHMGLGPESRRNVEFAALLHDIGKIAIPKEIINKPGRLEPDEWTIIKTHTIEGQRMLERVGGFMREVGLIVRSHHERWDGAGYPDHLAGESIPLEARIIACCDTWNAMRTDRAYRRALSHEVALAELMGNSGTQLDPSVVAALLAVLGEPAPAAVSSGPVPEISSPPLPSPATM